MTRTKTIWRFFLAHQDSRQEAWFEEQARKGWHLERPGLLGFRFAHGAPTDAKYRLDYQSLRGEKRAEYLALFQDAGWDFLGEVVNRYYFRARPEALCPEIHSDPESRKDRIRRELRILVFLAALNGWNALVLGTKVLRELPWTGGRPAYMAPVDYIMPPLLVLITLTTLLLGWCAWKLLKALRREG